MTQQIKKGFACCGPLKKTTKYKNTKAQTKARKPR